MSLFLSSCIVILCDSPISIKRIQSLPSEGCKDDLSKRGNRLLLRQSWFSQRFRKLESKNNQLTNSHATSRKPFILVILRSAEIVQRFAERTRSWILPAKFGEDMCPRKRILIVFFLPQGVWATVTSRFGRKHFNFVLSKTHDCSIEVVVPHTVQSIPSSFGASEHVSLRATRRLDH